MFWNRKVTDAVLAWFPAAVIFFLLPTSIYLSNQLDFDYSASPLLPFLIIATVLLGSLIAAAYAWPQAIRVIAIPLLLVGIFVFASDVIAPVKWGLMDGTEELTESWSSTAWQLLLLISLIAAWRFISADLLRVIGLCIVAVSVVSQLASLSIAMTRLDKPGSRSRAAPHALAGRPNIYHFVFDGYSSASFQQAARTVGLVDELQGFHFFRNNMSNYDVTDASVPSFLTGRLFEGGSFKTFQSAARTGGMRRALQESGYAISIYSPDRSRFWTYEGADHVYTSQDINSRVNAGRLAQIVAVRAAPEPFRREAFALSQRLVGGKKDSYAFYRRLSVPLIGRFIEDERQRPSTGQYIYVHVILPHPPYIWRENCTQTKATTYGEQLTCATRLMKQLIECLKKEGKYNDALILLQSDHGFQDDLNAKGLLAVSEDARKEVSSRQNYFTDDGFFSRLSSLLLIKLPGAPSAPLETSDAQSQLIDVPATVYDALGIAAPPTAGHSVFKLSEIPPREVSVFTGLYRRDGSGKPIVLGRNETKVELSHLKRRPDGTWRVEPPITATHEGW